MKNTLKSDVYSVTTEQIRNYLQAVSENEDYSIENYGTYNIEEIIKCITERDAFKVIRDINITAIGDFAEAISLFNEICGTDFDSVSTPAETVVFKPQQIKSADPVTYDNEGNVIPLSERFNFEKVDIRWQPKKVDSAGINTDYSDLSKLDSESLRVYNDRGWARGLLTKEDNALLNRRLGEIFHENSKYVRTTLADETVVLDLNNKILLISGDLANPVIDGVFAINAINEADAEFVREDVKYELQNARFDKETFTAFLKSSEIIYGEESVRAFDRYDYQHIKGQRDTGDRATLPDPWQNYGYTSDKRDGEGVSRETEDGVPRGVLKKQTKSLEDMSEGETFVPDVEDIALVPDNTK